MTPTRVKLCGVTTEDDARACADAGAWAIGLILSPMGPRALDAARAERVRRAIPPGVLAVGVVVNEPPARAAELARALGLDLVQLHGDEPPETLGALPVPAIRAFAIDPASPRAPAPARLAAFATAYAALVDARSGGSGRTFPWDVLDDPAFRAALPGGRLVLAGGLDPTNVAAAVRRVRPFAVDVASGIEREPGKKDRARIAAFVREVARADAELATSHTPLAVSERKEHAP